MTVLNTFVSLAALLPVLIVAFPTGLPPCKDNSAVSCECKASDSGDWNTCKGYKFNAAISVYCRARTCADVKFSGALVEVKCEGQHACNNAVFAGNVEVECASSGKEHSTCKATTFNDNVKVSCDGPLACKGSSFSGNTKARCGGVVTVGRNEPECRHARFTDNAKVDCDGKWSCKHSVFDDNTGATCSAHDNDIEAGSCSLGHEKHTEDSNIIATAGGNHHHRDERTGYCLPGQYGYPKDDDGCIDCPNEKEFAKFRGVGSIEYRCYGNGGGGNGGGGNGGGGNGGGGNGGGGNGGPLDQGTNALVGADDGMASWMIAVIVIGALLAAALVAGVVIMLRRPNNDEKVAKPDEPLQTE